MGMLRKKAIELVWVCVLLIVSTVCGEHWAVIVAGSTGYWNYRHQSDACHAYHVVKSHGIPESNIVVMMYDDVASSTSNPFPGKLYNRPSKFGSSAVDVYGGCHIDYRGDDVTPTRFLQVLQGNSSAGKKVLKSTANDRIFVNFIDHGAQGFVVFPKSNLYANDLISTLQTMYDRKLYKELVFYMEACESGSMFKNLPNNINVFVTTAANARESSWATYCPPFGDKVNGKRINTCLGDLYSVNWMEDSDTNDLSHELIDTQYKKVKSKTNKSHVLEFGSTLIPLEPVGDFQSTNDIDAEDSALISDIVENSDEINEDIGADSEQFSDIDSHDVELVTKFYQYLNAESLSDKNLLGQHLMRTIQKRMLADQFFELVPVAVNQIMPFTSVNNVVSINSEEYQSCIASVNTKLSSSCAKYTDYSLQYSSVFATLCEEGYPPEILSKSIDNACVKLAHSVNVFNNFNNFHVNY